MKRQIKVYFHIFWTVLFLATGNLSFGNTIVVGTDQKFRSIKSALAASQKYDTIIITKGLYKEGNIIIDKPVYLLGQNRPVLDGQLKYEVLSVKSDDVTIKGLQIQNSGRSVMKDDGAIKI